MYNNYKYSDLVVTAAAYNRKVSIEIPVDGDIHDLFEAFSALATGVGYHPESFFRAAEQFVEDRRPSDT
jgi:anthranilate/para-aminobenzoate synthase component II